MNHERFLAILTYATIAGSLAIVGQVIVGCSTTEPSLTEPVPPRLILPQYVTAVEGKLVDVKPTGGSYCILVFDDGRHFVTSVSSRTQFWVGRWQRIEFGRDGITKVWMDPEDEPAKLRPSPERNEIDLNKLSPSGTHHER